MATPADFVHLHVHSGDSLRRGMLSPWQIVEAARELEMTAVALTDHAMLSAVPEFHRVANGSGVRPIVGAEIAVESPGRPSHLVLLAESEAGYRNLVRIVSRAHLFGRIGEPVVDKGFLHVCRGGLIALSGCLDGEISRALLRGDGKTAERVALEYRESFGAGNFYLELQDTGIPGQREVNCRLVALGQRLGLPVVATANCRYLHIADAGIFHVKTRIHAGGAGEAPSPHGLYHFRTAQEMAESFRDLPAALESTLEIAERCTALLPDSKVVLPSPSHLESTPREERLSRLARKGFGRIIEPLTPELHLVYVERYREELRAIEEMRFGDYLVLAWDVVRQARAAGSAVGPGRGSLQSSLVAYCLGLTAVDPIAHGLHFERFLHPGQSRARATILFDFDVEGRDALLSALVRNYGYVARTLEFECLWGEELLIEVAAALEVPDDGVRAIARLAPEAFSQHGVPDRGSVSEHLLLAEHLEANPVVAYILDIARSLDGMKLRVASGSDRYVIATDRLQEELPLCRDDIGAVVVQWDEWALDRENVHYFVLGAMPLLSVMRRLERQVLAPGGDGRLRGLDEIPLDDQATYSLIAAGDIRGTHPHESEEDGENARVARALGPACVEDVAAMYALCRPGPLSAGMVSSYASWAPRGPSGGPVPIVSTVLEESRGVLVYQEQVVKIIHGYSGMTVADAESLRVLLAKRWSGTQIDCLRQRYLYQTAKAGLDRREAERVYEWLQRYASLAFMKAHALAYAILLVRAAYLKCHHREAFLAACAIPKSAGESGWGAP